MFNNFGNGQGNSINVSTRFNVSASETSSLVVGAWNQNISIRITPSIGVDENGNRMYDKNRAFQTALTQDNAKSLYCAYEKNILPLIQNNTPEEKSVSVPVGKDEKRSMVAIEMKPVENGYDMYLTCYTLLNGQNVTQESNIFRHKFKKSVSVTNYNYHTGGGEVEEQHGDFLNFIDKIREVSEILPIAAHGVRYENAVSSSYRGNSNNAGSSGNSYGGGFQNTTQQINQPAMNGYQMQELPFLP